MNTQLLLTLLSTSAVSIIFGGVITGLYNLRLKQNEYVNDYYKTVTNKRLEAYEKLEELIVALKIAVVDEDGRPYHQLFASTENWTYAFAIIGNVMSKTLWLSEEAFTKTRDLNYLLFLFQTPTTPEIVDFGKEQHKQVAAIRTSLEQILARDMLNLHDVKAFLKQKKSKSEEGYHLVHLKKKAKP